MNLIPGVLGSARGLRGHSAHMWFHECPPLFRSCLPLIPACALSRAVQDLDTGAESQMNSPALWRAPQVGFWLGYLKMSAG